MRCRGIRLPLPTLTAKRLGTKRIAAVLKALAQGIPKIEIQKRYDVTAWSILRIELDRPELGNAHRRATISLQQKKHRTALLSFFHNSPGESRRTFAIRHAGTYNWLQRYDRDWLKTHLPKPAYRGPQSPRKALKNWHQLDQAAASVVRNAAHKELVKPGRPFRLTRMRLLSVAGATVAMSPSKRYRYTTAAAEAERLAETKEQFQRRTIRWALEEFARLHRVISITQLCRVSSLRQFEFLEYRDYIIEVAAELELLFHPQCVLAISHDNSNASSVLTTQ
jgi:Tn7-like transposition protein D